MTSHSTEASEGESIVPSYSVATLLHSKAWTSRVCSPDNVHIGCSIPLSISSPVGISEPSPCRGSVVAKI